eukprot:6482843-Amphidinium_carterae.1
MKTFHTWTIFDPREKHSSVSEGDRYSLVAYSRMAVPDEVRETLNHAGFRPLQGNEQQSHPQQQQLTEQQQPHRGRTISPTLPFPTQGAPGLEEPEGIREQWQVCRERLELIISDEEQEVQPNPAQLQHQQPDSP